jgi:cell division protein FtsN
VPKDYKHRRRPGKRKPGTAGTFVTGLAVGLAVALLVHLYHQGQKRRVDRPSSPKQSEVTKPVVDEFEQKYDFYELLPDFEVVLPGEIQQKSAAGNRNPATPGQAYYIQAGSFTRFEDADRRKAALALLGIVSNIRKAEVNGRTTHRILIGPVSDPNKLGNIQIQLSSNGIEYITLKSREPAG